MHSDFGQGHIERVYIILFHFHYVNEFISYQINIIELREKGLEAKEESLEKSCFCKFFFKVFNIENISNMLSFILYCFDVVYLLIVYVLIGYELV